VTSVTGKDGGLCAVDGGGATYCGYTSSFLKAGKVKPLDLKGLKAIQSTGSAGFGLLSSGQVFLWNDPEHLQKINVNGLADGVSVASTGLAVCAVRRSGKVGCAGYSYKTFAKQDPLKPTNAVDVPDLKDAVHIAGDAGTMCVIKKTGAVSCFSTYRVPSPVDPKKEKEKAKEKAKEKEKPRPIETKALEGLDDVTALAAGGGQFCAVKKDATLWCWGSNRNGELGRGDYVSSEKPAPVPGLTDVAEVALAGGHVCALKKGGEVLCWGKSSSDEAGQPAPAYARSPVPVALPGAAP
jgi:alpha-tubulin suppressor-like RCC1 family protein